MRKRLRRNKSKKLWWLLLLAGVLTGLLFVVLPNKLKPFETLPVVEVEVTEKQLTWFPTRNFAEQDRRIMDYVVSSVLHFKVRRTTSTTQAGLRNTVFLRKTIGC